VALGFAGATSSEIHNTVAYSTANQGINVNGSNCLFYNTVGYSSANYGINGFGTNDFYNCVGISTSSVGWLNGQKMKHCVARSSWNNSGGHAFEITNSNGKKYINCHGETANSSANGIRGTLNTAYVLGCSFDGMTTAINISGNSQVNVADSFGNILLG